MSLPFASTRSISAFPRPSRGRPVFFLLLAGASLVIWSTACLLMKPAKARLLIPTVRFCTMWYPASRLIGTSAVLLSRASRRYPSICPSGTTRFQTCFSGTSIKSFPCAPFLILIGTLWAHTILGR